MSCGFIMQNYTNHSELLIGQFYFVENKAASSETALSTIKQSMHIRNSEWFSIIMYDETIIHTNSRNANY